MIYLDNSATTPLCAGAKNAIEYAMEHFGNPSSLHFAGEEGAKILLSLIREKREEIAKNKLVLDVELVRRNSIAKIN